jgi:hypothetical protein
VPAGFDRSRYLSYIGGAILRISQEVEHGTVMPYVVVVARERKRRNVTAQPIDRAGAFAKTRLSHIERRGRHVENRYTAIATVEQVID